MGKEKSNLFEEMNTGREGLGNLEMGLLQDGGFGSHDRRNGEVNMFGICFEDKVNRTCLEVIRKKEMDRGFEQGDR